MNKYSILGIIGLVLGIIAIFFLLYSILIPDYSGDILLYIILGIIALIFAMAYCWKRKDKIGLAGFIIGLIVIIIFIILLVVFINAFSCAC